MSLGAKSSFLTIIAGVFYTAVVRESMCGKVALLRLEGRLSLRPSWRGKRQLPMPMPLPCQVEVAAACAAVATTAMSRLYHNSGLL